jgi:long-chain fatty acid transport protein
MQFSPQLKRYLISVFAASTFIFSANIFAGAFQLWEESAAGLGDYHAGAAAEANDASTIFYNPAGMSRIKHQQVSLGAVGIDLKAGFQGNVYIPGPPVPDNLVGTTLYSEPGDTFSIIPNFHYVLPINNRLAFGIDETTPFGASTDYVDINTEENLNNPTPDYVDDLATKTKLETINLNPSLSYAFNHYISVGAGFDALYGQATYNSVGLFAPLTNKLIGWGYGYNAGVLFQFTPETRAGLSYRSAITIPATGPSTFDAGAGDATQSTVNANFPLPATTMFSVYHDMTHSWVLMASAFYTQWSCFKMLVINNMAQPPGNPAATVAINENYRNTWNFALGSIYKFNQHISLEAGFGHDQTPTSLPYRDIRLPDMSHYVASIGININPTKTIQWSMGWTHLFLGNVPVDNSGSLNAAQSSSSVPSAFAIGQGTVNTSANVFGMQLTFDV